MVPRKMASSVSPLVTDCPIGHFHPKESFTKYNCWLLWDECVCRMGGLGVRSSKGEPQSTTQVNQPVTAIYLQPPAGSSGGGTSGLSAGGGSPLG
jgi:hypothetical protein